MRLVDWADFVASRASGPFAATVGVFDGLHQGHRRLIDSVLAKSPALKTAAVTFKENPKKILRPQNFNGSLFSLGQKTEAFAGLGFDYCVLIDFSRNFGTLSGAEFLALLADAGMRFLCVGPNFRCGHNMDTNAQALALICRELGVETEIVEPVLYGGHPVSSSRIRASVLSGRLEEAAAMLGRPYVVDVLSGETGPSGALELRSEAVLPPSGLYRVLVEPEGERKAMTVRVENGRIIAAAAEAGAEAFSRFAMPNRVAILNVVS